MDKFGAYITKLMTTVLDKEQDEFVVELAWNELNRLKVNIDEFITKHQKNDDAEVEKTSKILLQEQQEKQTKEK
jgi:hypothetical protein